MKRCTDTIEDHSSEPDSAFFRTRHADSYAACGIAVIRFRSGVMGSSFAKNGICCKQRLHRFATSLVWKEESVMHLWLR